MKILHIISIGRVVGGAEKNTFIVNDLHRKLGHDVKTLSSDIDQKKGLLSDYTFRAIRRDEKAKFFRRIFNVPAYRATRHILKKWEPDIVHIHTIGQISPLPFFLLKNHKTVMHLHGPEVFIPPLLPWCLDKSLFISDERSWSALTLTGKMYYVYFRYVVSPAYWLGIRHVDLFLAPSKYIGKASSGTVTPIAYLPSGIHLKRYQGYPTHGPILYVGRLDKVKGVDYLVHAMKEVVAKLPKVQLIIVGKGSHEQELKDLAAKLNLTKNIVFAGWIELEEIETYYKLCRMLVIPSIWPENFPSVCNEAMSIGRPVIGTCVGGIPELIKPGKNGLLVPPKDSKTLARAIIRLCQDPKLAEQMGKNGHEDVKKFDFDLHAKKLLKIYEKVLAGQLDK